MSALVKQEDFIVLEGHAFKGQEEKEIEEMNNRVGGQKERKEILI